MTAADLLGRLRAAGVILTATADGRIECDGPADALDDATLAAIAEHRSDLLAMLGDPCAGLPMLAGDRSFVERVTDNVPLARRESLLREYARRWICAAEIHPPHKAANAGRSAANTWLRLTAVS